MSPTIEQLRRTVAQASARNPELTGRIEKAAALLVTREVRYVGEGLYCVPSQEKPNTSYYVTLGVQAPSQRCQCPDAQSGRAPNGFCKHSIAACLLKLLSESSSRRTAANDRVMIEVGRAAAAGVRVL